MSFPGNNPIQGGIHYHSKHRRKELECWQIQTSSIHVYDSLCRVVRQIWHSMYSSSHLQPGKMSCQCRMVAFFGETKWSFPKQIVTTCWGSYMKLIQARLGWRGWHVCLSGGLDWITTLNKRQELLWIPKLLAQSSAGTAYTLEMTKSGMVMSSHRFCGTLQRSDVLGRNWCALQVVGSSPNAYNYSTSYHSASKKNLCPVWLIRKSCVGQWTNLYQLGIE